MAVSVSIIVIVIALHLIAFVFAVRAERRRSIAKVVPDQYDERTFCKYDSDASKLYGLAPEKSLLRGIEAEIGIGDNAAATAPPGPYFLGPTSLLLHIRRGYSCHMNWWSSSCHSPSRKK
ncbi:hypothetical protein BVRB_6g142420 [Beta vulgaris subsp. vulgaris]|nr:hypothetical protein BVRB_6g142420 [Beta vulgaris subsp. vulgaris]